MTNCQDCLDKIQEIEKLKTALRTIREKCISHSLWVDHLQMAFVEDRTTVKILHEIEEETRRGLE